MQKGVKIDDIKLFDEFANIERYVAKMSDDRFSAVHQKWADFFNSANISCSTELLKVVIFFSSIPSHNTNVERVFALITSQWTKERNKLSIDSIKMITAVKFNLKDMTCQQFFDYILRKKDILKQRNI